MGDSKAVYSTRSKDEGNVIRRLLQRHGIPVVSSPRLLGSLLPGSRFDEVDRQSLSVKGSFFCNGDFLMERLKDLSMLQQQLKRLLVERMLAEIH